MKKVAIITMNGNDNYGNKLQHIAVQTILEKKGVSVSTLAFWNYSRFEYFIKDKIKYITRSRYRHFKKFDKLIRYSKSIFYKNNKYKIDDTYDYYVVGSDQVWNSTISSFRTFYLLDFVKNNNKKISFSASFGTDFVLNNYIDDFKNYLKDFKYISVREDAGYKIVKELTGRTDSQVLLDPTMLLTADEWDHFAKKPKQYHGEKYILNYFLGELSDTRKKEIERVANKCGYKIINLLDPNDPFNSSGPSEFLWLEKNASLICTDSFHSSVFAVIYNRPFIVFDREQDNLKNLNSRIDTLISKLNLKNRRFEERVNEKNLNHDYTESYKILESERNKSSLFLEDALSDYK